MSHNSFSITDSKGKTTPMNSFKQDTSSKQIYGPFQTYNSIDVTTQVAADTQTQTEIDDGAYKHPGFTLVLKGCTLFEPSQYIATILNSRRMNGIHIPVAITHSFNLGDKIHYETKIDFNKPSKTFMHLIVKMKKDLEHQGIQGTNSIFTGYSTGIIGNTSTGAFSQ
jgi:hypothetical protein